MVISEEWSSYRDDDIGKANFVKEKIVNDDWWEKVSYIIDFTRPIYDMIRYCDTDKLCLHLVYEMWDSMIEKVKLEIYKKEGRPMSEFSSLMLLISFVSLDEEQHSSPLPCTLFESKVQVLKHICFYLLFFFTY